MQTGKRILGIEVCFWLALSITAYALTFEFDDPIQAYLLGATAWPRGIIFGIFIVALLQFGLALKRAGGAAKAEPAAEKPPAQEPEAKPVLKIVLSFALPLFYLLILPRVGFYLLTPAFLCAYLFLLGERRWGRLIPVTAIIYAIMILVFTVVFYVPLPVGYWSGFYDINNWLLQLYR